MQSYIPFTDSDFECKIVIHGSLFFPIITENAALFFSFLVLVTLCSLKYSTDTISFFPFILKP